jgi:hypothetical protein
MPDQPTPTAIAAELAAMRRIVATLEGLDPAARARTLDWLVDRYGSEASFADREDTTR